MARKWQRRDLNPGPQLLTSTLHGFSPSCQRPLFLKRGFLVFKSHLGEQGLTKAWPTCPLPDTPLSPKTHCYRSLREMLSLCGPPRDAELVSGGQEMTSRFGVPAHIDLLLAV